MKTKQQMIDDIMDNFDFSRVAKVMEVLEWTWWDIKGIAEEYDIRMKARKLLNAVPETFSKDERYTGSGGFYVRSLYENTELVLIELTFVVSEWRVDVSDV